MGDSYLADIPGNHFNLPFGSFAAIASSGANGVLPQSYWRAPADLIVLSVHKIVSANEVTAGTAVSSASYRRTQLCNGGPAGTATTLMASLNNTASTALGGSKAMASVSPATAAEGDILYLSQLTVGAATADGTDAAAGTWQMEYRLL